MDLASVAMGTSMMQTAGAVDVALTRKAMDFNAQQAAGVVELMQDSRSAMEQSVRPHIGSSIDIQA